MLDTQHHQLADQILKKIQDSQHILLHLHRNPDGDSIGSNMAIAQWLTSIGKQVTIANFTPIPANLLAYCNLDWVSDNYPADLVSSHNVDLHVSLDSSDWNIFVERNTELSEEFKNLPRINIDHHGSNTQFGDLNLVDPSYTSCAQLLCDIVNYWQVPMEQTLADRLLLGIVTDTGGFRWAGVNAQTLRVAADLIDAKADLEKINFNAFKRVPFNVLKLWKILLGNMQLNEEFKCIHTYIDYLSVYDVGEDGMNHDITSNVLLSSIEGTDFGFVLKERRPNHIEVSMRGRTGKVDVSKIAVALGGGGHPIAAGCLLKDMTISQAQKCIFHEVSLLLK